MALQNTDHLLVQRSGSSYKMEASDIIPFLEAEGFGTSSVTVSATAPVGPTAGDMWWNSDDGNLYIYYQDADTTQWVPSNSDGGGFVNATVGANVPTDASQGDLWYSTSDARLYIYDGAVWIDASPASAPNISTISDTAPSTPASGDLWYDLDSARLYVYNGSAWVDSAPGYGIQDGAVGTTQLADDAVTAAKIDSSALARNLIINGAMAVAQRGTSSTSVGLGTVDRWHSGGSGGTITQTQEDLSSADSPYTEGFRKFFRQTNTAVASATSDYRQVETKLEAQDIATSGWNYTSPTSNITVSAWIRSSVAGTYSYQLRTADGTAQSYVGTVTLDADTWTMVTQTYPGNTNLTFDNDSNLGLRVIWFPYLGTDYTTSSPTLNAWHSFNGTNMTGDDTAGWGTTAGATFDITGVQLTATAEPLPFQHEDYGTTLRKCQRYYETIAAGMEAASFYAGGNTNDAYRLVVPFQVRKRDIPTLTHPTYSGVFNTGINSSTATVDGYYRIWTAGTAGQGAFISDSESAGDAEL